MRSEAACLCDIFPACEAFAEYIKGHTAESFEKASIVHDAVHYQLMIIGEATRYLSEQTKAQIPQIPWPLVRRTRNVLIHDYLNVDESIVWETVVKDIPSLAEAVRAFSPPKA
jgi:uncharacterized protein with HEPN domain